MAKYDRLADHLRSLNRSADQSFSFGEIEDVLGFPLPASARAYQAWWANQRNGRHVQANAWLDAGWHTQDLDLKARRVTFRPVSLPCDPTRRPAPSALADRITIAEAKERLAVQFGVRPDDVEITIRA